MRVAIIAPIFGENGGPELGTLQLADALVEEGIDVTLFAPEKFSTRAKLHPVVSKSLWSLPDFAAQTEQERANIIIGSQIEVLFHQDEFDIIHISSQRYAYSIARHLSVPSVLTLHNRIDQRDLALLRSTPIKVIALTEKYKEAIGADISIYPGIPVSQITPSYGAGKGLVSIGRLTKQKGVHNAIQVALKAEKTLTLIGRIGNAPERQAYYKKEILPFIDDKQIRHIENLPNQELLELIRQAEALVFSITQPETFGRVSIEALACGTPVIGSCMDPLPEILSDTNVAFLSDSIDALAEAAQNTARFDRTACRKYAEERFDIKKSAEKHILFYENTIRSFHQRMLV